MTVVNSTGACVWLNHIVDKLTQYVSVYLHITRPSKNISLVCLSFHFSESLSLVISTAGALRIGAPGDF